MTYELADPQPINGAGRETSEYRRTHFRVYDEDGYAGTFDSSPPESASLASVSAYLCARFAGTGGTGFASKDLVVLLGARIVAVVRKGADDLPHVTTFED